MTAKQEKIEKYLLGKMAVEERELFEKELEQNQDLASELSVMQLEHRAMDILLQDELKTNLNAWKAEKESRAIGEDTSEQREAKVIRGSFRGGLIKTLSIAAGVAILVVSGLFLFSGGDNSQAIATDYFGQATISAVRNGQLEEKGVESNSNALKNGALSIQAKDYKQAIKTLKPFELNADARFPLLLAEAYFHDGDYDSAITLLNGLKDRIDGPAYTEYQMRAEWFLLLTYLAKGGKKDSEYLKLMQKISGDDQHSFYPLAKELKDKM